MEKFSAIVRVEEIPVHRLRGKLPGRSHESCCAFWRWLCWLELFDSHSEESRAGPIKLRVGTSGMMDRLRRA